MSSGRWRAGPGTELTGGKRLKGDCVLEPKGQELYLNEERRAGGGSQERH